MVRWKAMSWTLSPSDASNACLCQFRRYCGSSRGPLRPRLRPFATAPHRGTGRMALHMPTPSVLPLANPQTWSHPRNFRACKASHPPPACVSTCATSGPPPPRLRCLRGCGRPKSRPLTKCPRTRAPASVSPTCRPRRQPANRPAARPPPAPWPVPVPIMALPTPFLIGFWIKLASKSLRRSPWEVQYSSMVSKRDTAYSPTDDQILLAARVQTTEQFAGQGFGPLLAWVSVYLEHRITVRHPCGAWPPTGPDLRAMGTECVRPGEAAILRQVPLLPRGKNLRRVIARHVRRSCPCRRIGAVPPPLARTWLTSRRQPACPPPARRSSARAATTGEACRGPGKPGEGRRGARPGEVRRGAAGAEEAQRKSTGPAARAEEAPGEGRRGPARPGQAEEGEADVGQIFETLPTHSDSGLRRCPLELGFDLGLLHPARAHATLKPGGVEEICSASQSLPVRPN